MPKQTQIFASVSQGRVTTPSAPSPNNTTTTDNPPVTVPPQPPPTTPSNSMGIDSSRFLNNLISRFSKPNT